MFPAFVADDVGPTADDVVGILVDGVEDCVELILVCLSYDVFIFVEFGKFVYEEYCRQQGDENEDENYFLRGFCMTYLLSCS